MRPFIYSMGILLVCLTAKAQSPIDRNKVMEYLQEQQYDQMITYLQPVADGNESRDLSLLAYAYHQSGKLNDAARIYERILLLDSNAVSALQSLAGIRMQQKRYQEALQLYQRLLPSRPGNASVWRQLSNAAYALGQVDSGFAWLSKAYQLNPADGRVAEAFAEQWIAKKEYEIADTVINAYLQSDSLNSSMLQMAAKTAYLLKHYRHTAEIGTRLRLQQVVSPAAFNYVIAACYQLKQYKDCIAIYDYLDQNQVSSENITYYAALASTELKDFKKSNALLQNCITMAKSDMLEIYYHCVSLNYESLKQYKPALACLDSSYYLSRRILHLYSMGRIYETNLNNMPAATKYYKRFLQLYKNEGSDERNIYDYLKGRMKGL